MCGVIVVDAEPFWSTWHGRDAYVHNHCLYILITMRFSINCSAVICSPTSETYGPRAYFTSYKFLIYNSSFLFILFCNLYFPIYTTKIPKIFILLSLLDLTFASDREGIDNPFIALVARFLIVCAGTRWLACNLQLDTLVLKKWGKYLRYFAASPFPLQGKTNAVLKR